LAVHDLAVVPALQHVFGLVTGGLVYALVRRLGGGAVAGSIAAPPVLFDAYDLNLEQHVLSEALFTLLVVVALVVLLWPSRPSPTACIATGILLAGAPPPAAGRVHRDGDPAGRGRPDAVGRPGAGRARAGVRDRARRARAHARP